MLFNINSSFATKRVWALRRFKWVSRPLFILGYFGLWSMNKAELTERISEIATRIAIELSFEMVAVKLTGSVKSPHVQIFIDKIDKIDGVTHDDCKVFSKQIGEILDAEDFISDEYILEVSSPGLLRDLYSLKDFERFVGSLAKVRLNHPQNGQRSYRGRIIEVESNTISFEDLTSGLVKFSFIQVSKASLEIDIDEELRLGKNSK
jgi:ribosome maturation factor RimP